MSARSLYTKKDIRKKRERERKTRRIYEMRKKPKKLTHRPNENTATDKPGTQYG